MDGDSESDETGNTSNQDNISKIAEFALEERQTDASFQEIKELMDKVVEKDVETVEGSRKSVTLFRETMEYAEQFGIHLLAEFEECEDIPNRLTNYTPNEVRTFYQHIATKNGDSFCSASDEITGNYTTNLRSAFDLPNDITGIDGFDLFKNQIVRIARFYTNFYDIYNAVKHAKRYEIMNVAEFSTEVPIELNEETLYIVFVPKNSSEAASTLFSGRLLANYSFGVARRIHRLSEAMENKDAAEGDQIGIRLVDDGLESFLDAYQEVSGESFALYGKFEQTEDFEQSSCFHATIEYHAGELQFHLQEEDEYGPFTVNLDSAPQFMGTVGQTVSIGDIELTRPLTIDQYEQFVDLHQDLKDREVKSIRLFWQGEPVGGGMEHATLEEWGPSDGGDEFLRTDVIDEKHIELLKAMNEMCELELLAPPHLSDENLQMLVDQMKGRKTTDFSGDEIQELTERIYDL
jgi:hypothetical protein